MQIEVLSLCARIKIPDLSTRGSVLKTLKGLSENPTDNSKIENEVKNEVISLTSSFPIYKNL